MTIDNIKKLINKTASSFLNCKDEVESNELLKQYINLRNIDMKRNKKEQQYLDSKEDKERALNEIERIKKYEKKKKFK